MKKSEKIKKKVNNFLFDHMHLKMFLENSRTILLCLIAGALFAFGFTCFITPADSTQLAIVTGGVSGISQNIYLIIRFFNSDIKLSDIASIFYLVLNIPILIFAFFAISKKFAIFSALNVVVSSIFIRIFPTWFQAIAELMNENGGIVARVFFGAMCTGISSALAYRANCSCGGIDVFSYYFALRKSTSVGKYALMINGTIITLYTVLSIIQEHSNWERGILIFFFAITYLFIVAVIIDFINVRNKKVQIQIITSKEHMPEVLLANFPHGATIVKGRGAYSGTDRQIIFMIVSSVEVKRVVALCQRVDEHVFISVNSLIQVYGNFFIKPIE